MRYWPDLLTTPALHLWLTPLLAVAALQCLTAIWAASSRRHWFLRALAVWAGLLILVPIRAYEAVWLFALSSALIVLMQTIARWWDRRNEHAAARARGEGLPAGRWRFSLGDLLLLLLWVGLVLALAIEVIRAYRPTNWIGWVTSAGALSILSVLCHASSYGPRRRWAIGALIFAVPLCAALAWVGGDMLRVWDFANIGGSLLEDVVSLSIAGLEFSLLVIAFLALNRARSGALSTRRRIALSSAQGVLLAALLAPTAALYWALIAPVPRAAKYQVPTGNHFDEIAAIAGQLRVLNRTELSIADLRAAAPKSPAPQQVEALYAELQRLLRLPNAAGYDPARDALMNYSPPIQELRSLCRALLAESKAQRAAGKPELAADYAEACLRLGAMLRRGGTAVEALVGAALESVGQGELAALRPDLAPERSRALLHSLARTLAEQEDFEALRVRELDYENRAYGWQGRLENAAMQWIHGGAPWSSLYQAAAARNDAWNLLFQTDLAIRLFQHEHGRLPASLSELAPAYLPDVPRDPYAPEHDLQYRTEAGAFVLYSAGPDGVDNGGKFANRNALSQRLPGYDFDLDTWTRP
jgi:hypothetical protein